MSLSEKLGIQAAGETYAYSQKDISEFIRCSKDHIYFAENYYTIVNLDKGRQKFTLWDYQKRVTKDIWEPHYYADGSLRRHNLIMQARQSGKTMTVSMNLLHYALFNSDKTIAILANKERTSIEILRKIKFAYQNLPKFLKVGIVPGGWNKKTIQFENGSRIFAAATSEDAIRGESVNVLYLDEFAFVREEIADEFIASVFPTILSGETTKIIIVSTPNPRGINHFYYMAQEAELGTNGFFFTKVQWDETPGHDENWKKRTIKEIGLRKWESEYELKFFGMATSLLVDADIIRKIITRDPIYTKYDGLMNIYEDPIENAYYILGVDTGKGIGRDYSIIVVLKIMEKHKTEVVAIYRSNKVDVYDFSKVVVDVSNWYNEAYLMIENNDLGRIVCEQVFWIHECDRIINNRSGELGIAANHKTKSEADLLMKKYIESNWISINDRAAVAELSKYVEKKPDIFAAESPKDHDDVMAGLKWSIYFFETPNFDPEFIKARQEGKENSADYDAPVHFFDDSSTEDIDEMLALHDPRLDILREINEKSKVITYTSNVIGSHSAPIPYSPNSQFGAVRSYDCGLSR